MSEGTRSISGDRISTPCNCGVVAGRKELGDRRLHCGNRQLQMGRRAKWRWADAPEPVSGLSLAPIDAERHCRPLDFILAHERATASHVRTSES